MRAPPSTEDTAGTRLPGAVAATPAPQTPGARVGASRRTTAAGGESSSCGTRSVDRALRILDVVIDARDEGIRSVDAAKRAQMHVATAHRLLKALVRAKYAAFDGYRKKYYLGERLVRVPELVPPELLPVWREAALRIRDLTGETVYLYARSGLDIVCLDRIEGVHPVPSLIRAIGVRIPIGANSGSAHMLACMSTDAADRMIHINAERLAAFKGLGVDEIWAEVRAARVRGFGVNDNRILRGVVSLGLALVGQAGDPVGCLCVSAASHRFGAQRRSWVAQQIRETLGMHAGASATKPDAPTGVALRRSRGARR